VSNQPLYDRAFAIADRLWAAGFRLEAGWIAVATDGTTSGEVLPKLHNTLRSLQHSRRVIDLGLDAECSAIADEVARRLGH
jgi:hypothetical protein